jgi:hypothetical protein
LQALQYFTRRSLALFCKKPPPGFGKFFDSSNKEKEEKTDDKKEGPSPSKVFSNLIYGK